MPGGPGRGSARGRLPRALSAWGLVAAGVALALTGAASLVGGSAGHGEPGAANGGPVASPAPTTPAAVRAPVKPGSPRRLLVPALGIDAPVVPVKAPGRRLVPPADADVLGWWADGALPGAPRGSALVAGHTVHNGGGALEHLEDLRAGDQVAVRTRTRTLRYVVERVHVYTKGRIRDDAERLFSQDVPGRLVLVTCEDWDGTAYLSNVVVVAVPQRR